MDQEDLRMFACDTIQLAGILLRLPQVATTTAQMLLQRVYHTPEYTFDRYPLDITAMAALFLGSKIEEYPRKAREVIDVFTYVVSQKLNLKNKKIVLSYQEHETIRNELITAERRLLKNLGFNLLSSYPHKIIVNYHRAIINVLDPDGNIWEEQQNNDLLQVAWNYCNDSLRTDIFIRYNEIAVACACIQMACNDVKMPFPKSTDGRYWYNLFVKDVSEVEDSIKLIKNLYNRKTPDTSELIRHVRLMKFATTMSPSPSRHHQNRLYSSKEKDRHRSHHHHHHHHQNRRYR